jgi:hypothetical protein
LVSLAGEPVPTRPEVERIRRPNGKIPSLVVRRPAFDAGGAERGLERSSHLVGIGPDGKLAIRVAVLLDE